MRGILSRMFSHISMFSWGLRKSLAIFEDKNALLKTDFRFSLNFAQSFPKICQIKKEEMDDLLFMMDYVTVELQIISIYDSVERATNYR